LLLQDWKNPAGDQQLDVTSRQYSILLWIGWVDDNTVLGLVVGDQIGIVVAATLPWLLSAS